ncbi:MAG: phosphatidylserine decarboxylase family protein [Bacteroidaceae bacterium]|nr:phosphatidylserine decarboxylase family protein [Bacteroidaceae bacterium]
MKKIKKIKKIRIHHEGTRTLIVSAILLLAINALLYFLIPTKIPFYCILTASVAVYAILVNFYRCPIRIFEGETTKDIVVAPADGKVVVLEEVDENEFFHDRRLMISIFMSPLNVHANWFPVDGYVKMVAHQNGNFHKAFLPKASMENERSTVVITTPDHGDIMVRQVAGAVARRIVTYAHENEECYIDEHLGFIKLGSRVDVYLPVGTEICIKLGQATVGNDTIIAKLR